MADDDAASALTRLIDIAERLLYRGALLDPAFDEFAATIAKLRADTLGFARHVGDEAVMLCTALRNLDRHATNDAATRWAMIAGALLPMVKRALGRAIDDRRTTAMRPDPEAQPNYRGGRER